MPGIFGVIDTSGETRGSRHEDLVRVLARMSATMQYDTLYSADTVIVPEVGAYIGRVGWPSDGDVGGLRSGETDIVLLATGEPVCEGLGRDAHVQECGTVRGCANGRGILEAYARLGEKVVAEFDGVFAGIIVDRRRRECLLFNDRFGVERVFVYLEGDRTFFASEAKAILAVVPDARTFDEEGLAQFLGCGYTFGTRSLFRGIEVLRGGTLLGLRAGGHPTQRVYADATALEGMKSEDRVLSGLYESLASAVRSSVTGPPGGGVSLTGGLDSRMIMACLQAPAGSVPCYTFGSMYRNTFDVNAGRQVADMCRQPHRVLELDDEFIGKCWEHLEDAVFISDGYLGVSGAAELYLNRKARSIAPVRVTGNWGGELLRGVRGFKHVVPSGGFLSADLEERLGRTRGMVVEGNALTSLSKTLFQQIGAQGYGRYAIERSQVLMRLPFLSNEVVRWLYRLPATSRSSSDVCASIIGMKRPELLAIPTDQGLLGTGWKLVRVGRRVYRQAMCKAEYWTSHGAPHWWTRLGATKPGALIEGAFRGRNKFQHFQAWFRGELAGRLRETLLDGARRDLEPWFRMKNVELLVRNHLGGLGNYTDEIDKLLTVALASRRLLRASTS
jgi:asparagine synthase (glutamine-hydrolysing)